ncbi:MAG TPA: DUF2269 family protein [Ktedonobacterales bacterium]|nr:DUF2269 family protein [Ktedonobacterales bacterium]
MLYTLALFAHIVGVLGIFVGISFGWVNILRLRRAQTIAQVRAETSLTGVQQRLFPIAALVLLLAGIYMTVTTWGWGTPWILLSLAALIVMGVLGGAVSGRRLTTIRKAAAEDASSAISPELQRLIADPVLLISIQTALLIGLGVVFLMTMKPDWTGSLITLGVAVVLGVVSAQPWRRPAEVRARVQEAQASSARN